MFVTEDRLFQIGLTASDRTRPTTERLLFSLSFQKQPGRSPPFVDIQTDPSPDFAVEFEQFRDQHLRLGLKLSRRGGLGDQAVQNASDRPSHISASTFRQIQCDGVNVRICCAREYDPRHQPGKRANRSTLRALNSSSVTTSPRSTWASATSPAAPRNDGELLNRQHRRRLDFFEDQVRPHLGDPWQAEEEGF